MPKDVGVWAQHAVKGWEALLCQKRSCVFDVRRQRAANATYRPAEDDTRPQRGGRGA